MSLKALIVVIIWGASFVATKLALPWLSPTGLVAARLTMGAVGLLLFVLIGRTPVRLPVADLGRCVLLGVILGAHLLIQNVGLQWTTATNTAWIVAFTPIIIAAGAWVFRGERIGAAGWWGIAVGASGVALICVAKGVRWERARLGDLLTLSTCVTWAAYTLLSVKLVQRRGPMSVTVWTVVVAALTVWPWMLQQAPVRGEFSTAALLALVYLGVICSAAAYWLWYGAVREIGSTAAGSYLYIEPFVTWLLAGLWLGETLNLIGILGGACVLFGVWLVAGDRRGQVNMPSPSNTT